MICAERTLGIIDAPKVQIFATDIDDNAIAIGRERTYTINDAADVSPERLRRFFNREGDGYRVRREIREMILFANHNVIKDPPFSHLDMVSCRNMLIYLNHSAQERVLETFHFALNSGGYLFLGSSESADSASDLYTYFNREHHIFQSRQVLMHSYPVPESVPSIRQNPLPTISNVSFPDDRIQNRMTFGDLHMRLLEEYAPPSVVINEEYEIIHLSERAGRYLQISGGEPSQNLLKLVRPDIRLELRAALYQAVQRQTAVDAVNLVVNFDDHSETINIHVRPIFREDELTKGLILVLFERELDVPQQNEVIIASDEPVARQLEDELMRVKLQLRSSIEQHEFQAEELKASNEELQAMNEELRSAAEELETSKEELQSINEELRTVNQELKVKVEETTIAGNNLQNLINSADIATIFLDRSCRVALFTPPTTKLFNLIPNDIGRPLSDITNKLDNIDILSDAERVLGNLQTVEREVQAANGHLYMMRMLPYRTEEDKITGAVITFFDINERARAEEALRISEERYRAALQSANMAAWDWNIPQQRIVWNDQHFMILGVEPDTEPKTVEQFFRLIHPEDLQLVKGELARATTEMDTFRAQFRIKRADNGKIRWMRAFGRVVSKNANQAARMVGVMYDVTEQKLLEQQKDEFIGIASHELKTPLTSIKVFAEVLQERFEKIKDSDSADLMRKLNQQVERLAELVSDLLDTSKISEGRMILKREPTDLNKLITEISEDVQRTTRRHNIVLELRNIPLVSADRERIGQVVTNLLTNAVKYSPEGGDIHVYSAKEDHHVKVTVIDKGIGISSDSQARIFERFYRTTNPAISTYPGMGLGLYISAGIIHRHGGHVSVESKEGKGSVFSFKLPL
jgi:two-component system CheB/CheR fusion protein